MTQNTSPTWQEEWEKLWTIGSIGVEISFGHFTSAKNIEKEFIKRMLAQELQQARKDLLGEVFDKVLRIPLRYSAIDGFNVVRENEVLDVIKSLLPQDESLT